MFKGVQALELWHILSETSHSFAKYHFMGIYIQMISLNNLDLISSIWLNDSTENTKNKRHADCDSIFVFVSFDPHGF